MANPNGNSGNFKNTGTSGIESTLDDEVLQMPEAKKKDTKKDIERFVKLSDLADRIADTVDVDAHSAAFDEATKVIRDDRGRINYKLLKDDPDKQREFAETASKRYLKGAMKHGRSSLDEGDDDYQLVRDQLMDMYAGITYDQIHRNVRTHGANYKKAKHTELMAEAMREVRGKLNASASGHLTDEHTKELVKHMGIDKMVDPSKMTIDDARTLYGVYKENKGLTAEQIENAFLQANRPAPIYLKKKKAA